MIGLSLVNFIGVFRLRTLSRSAIVGGPFEFLFNKEISYLTAAWMAHAIWHGLFVGGFYSGKDNLMAIFSSGGQIALRIEPFTWFLCWFVTGSVGFVVELVFNETRLVPKKTPVKTSSLLERLADYKMAQQLMAAASIFVAGQVAISLVLFALLMSIFGRIFVKLVYAALSYILSMAPLTFRLGFLGWIGFMWHLIVGMVVYSIFWLLSRLLMSWVFSQMKILTGPKENSILLDGLQGKNFHRHEISLIQEHALGELCQILHEDVPRRVSLYNEFRGDQSTCRQVCAALTTALTELRSSLKRDYEDLIVMEECLVDYHRRHLGRFSEPQSVNSPADPQISPQKKPQPSSTSLRQRTSTPERPAILASTSTAIKKPTQSTPSIFKQNHQVNLERLLRFSFGRTILSLWISYHRTRTLSNTHNRLERLVEAVELFIHHSIDEDRHGQVQLGLEPMLAALTELGLLLQRLPNRPDQSILKALEVSSAPTPLSYFLKPGLEMRLSRTICKALQRCLERLGGGMDALRGINFSSTTLSAMHRLLQ